MVGRRGGEDCEGECKEDLEEDLEVHVSGLCVAGDSMAELDKPTGYVEVGSLVSLGLVGLVGFAGFERGRVSCAEGDRSGVGDGCLIMGGDDGKPNGTPPKGLRHGEIVRSLPAVPVVPSIPAVPVVQSLPAMAVGGEIVRSQWGETQFREAFSYRNIIHLSFNALHLNAHVNTIQSQLFHHGNSSRVICSAHHEKDNLQCTPSQTNS